MATVKIYNLEGVAVGDMELDAKIFSETGNSELFYQVVRVLQANSRTVLAHTKDRSQVRGGFRKTKLHGIIAIFFEGFNLRDHAFTSFDNGDRNYLAIVAVELGHFNFSAENQLHNLLVILSLSEESCV